MKFVKYHGSGNDFILLDGFQDEFNLEEEQIKKFCHRRLGIGSDGIIIIRACSEADVDFEMIFYNPDGSTGMMCGNGARCAVHFATSLGHQGRRGRFLAIDGIHKSELIDDKTISISIPDKGSDTFVKKGPYLCIDSGAPHVLLEVEKEKFDALNVLKKGEEIRYSEQLKPEGANVNFIAQLSRNTFKVRTYERGVENETLSCGTGITAAALGWHYNKKSTEEKIAYDILSRGGELSVRFDYRDGRYENIFLTGPVERVYEGIWDENAVQFPQDAGPAIRERV